MPRAAVRRLERGRARRRVRRELGDDRGRVAAAQLRVEHRVGRSREAAGDGARHDERRGKRDQRDPRDLAPGLGCVGNALVPGREHGGTLYTFDARAFQMEMGVSNGGCKEFEAYLVPRCSGPGASSNYPGVHVEADEEA